jgi:hypothetical protein
LSGATLLRLRLQLSRKKLVLFSPAAMLAYFEELAAAEAAGNTTPELLDAVAAQNNVEMLGPVPDNCL